MRSKKAIKNIIISILLQLVTVICGFITPRLIIQSFGSSVNGLISSIIQFLGYITLLESGIGPVIKAALYKPIANQDDKQIANILKASEKFFKRIAYIFIIYILILCIIYPIIMKNQFEIAFTISLVVIIAISTFAEYYFGMTYKLFLQAKQETYIASEIQILTTILNTLMVVILIKFGANIQIVKIASTLIFIIRPLIQNLYVKRKYNINFNDSDENYKLKNKWDGLAQHIAAVVHSNTDIAILTIFSTMKEVSVYSVYILIVNGVKNLVLSLRTGLDASFGDMIAKEENKTLNKTFKMYELFYFTIITIIFTATLILIVPFIKMYTKGITDVDYIRPLFATLIVIAEFIDCIRIPYSTLIAAAGRFKETRIGAWIEAGSNIVISISLVASLGIVGVAIGTLIAMLIRTIEFIIYTSKHILKRKEIEVWKRIVCIIVQTLIIYVINYIFFKDFIVNTYVNWFAYAIIIVFISSIIVIGMNFIIYKSEYKEAINLLKDNIKKTKKI